MTPRVPLALGAVALAATVSLSADAGLSATPVADLGVSARFDRRSVQPGQIAVADVTVRNHGPETGGTAALSLTASGGRIVRTRATGGRCGRPLAGRAVRCTVRVSSFGGVAAIVVHVRTVPGQREARLDARLSAARDPQRTDNRATADVRVSARPSGAQAELSYVFGAPARALVRRPFTARVRILNRGPRAALVAPISLTTTPRARVTMPTVPAQLAVGAEHTLVARVTPLRVGTLFLDLRVGQAGRSRLSIAVRDTTTPE